MEAEEPRMTTIEVVGDLGKGETLGTGGGEGVASVASIEVAPLDSFGVIIGEEAAALGIRRGVVIDWVVTMGSQKSQCIIQN